MKLRILPTLAAAVIVVMIGGLLVKNPVLREAVRGAIHTEQQDVRDDYIPELPYAFDGQTWTTPAEADEHCGGPGTSILIGHPSDPSFEGYGCLFNRMPTSAL